LRNGNRKSRLLLSTWIGGDDLDQNPSEIFARNLRFWLKKREISGAELGRKLGVERATVSAWLNQITSPSVRVLGEIATVLEIPARDLLHDPAITTTPRAPIEDEPEKALKIIAKELGFKFRGLEREKKG
jgi:transcriptional regulator with XRE-family HTH domain